MTATYIKAKIRQFEKRFNKLKWDTRDNLLKRQISVTKVVDALVDMPTDMLEEHQQFLENDVQVLYEEASITKLFAHAKLVRKWNYLSYHLLEHLIKEFELEKEGEMMAEYKNDLQKFRETTPLKLFCETQTKRQLKPSQEFEEVVGEFQWPDEVTLEVVEQFRQEYAYHYNLRECALMLALVRPGSFIITWYIPQCIVEKLKVDVPEDLLKKYNTTKLEIAGDCVYSSPQMPTETQLSAEYMYIDEYITMPQLHRIKEDDDRTGDSGMGTGSCSADYDGREQWKQAIKSPPTATEHRYAAIGAVETSEHKYESLLKDPSYNDSSPWFNHVSMVKCTADGIVVNMRYGFGIAIPKNSIHKQKTVIVDISVAERGPFRYPKGFRRVSPVFQISVRDPGFTHFLKPIEVTIPHCVDINDLESLGLTFLKSDHSLDSWQFNKLAESEMCFEVGKNYGVLKFPLTCKSSLCIAGPSSQKLSMETNFLIHAAISKVVPSTMAIHCRFYVSLWLTTSSISVKKQLDQIPEFQHHKLFMQQFKFPRPLLQYNQAFEIVCPDEMPAGWTVQSLHRTKILKDEIDTFSFEPRLKSMEAESSYPARFDVNFCGSQDATHSTVKIGFKGATKYLVFDISLNPQELQASPPQPHKELTVEKSLYVMVSLNKHRGDKGDNVHHELLPASCQLDHVDRDTAEKLLSAHGTPGVYLIRDGTHRGYKKIVSVWYPEKCYHTLWTNDKAFSYEGLKVQFSTLLEFIEFYSEHPLPNTTDIFMRVPYSQ